VDRPLPKQVDVDIVGSGPTVAVYARILGEESTSLRVACLRLAPLTAGPPGIHVKDIADPGLRSAAQRGSGGSGAVTQLTIMSAPEVHDPQRRPGLAPSSPRPVTSRVG